MSFCIDLNSGLPAEVEVKGLSPKKKIVDTSKPADQKKQASVRGNSESYFPHPSNSLKNATRRWLAQATNKDKSVEQVEGEREKVISLKKYLRDPPGFITGLPDYAFRHFIAELSTEEADQASEPLMGLIFDSKGDQELSDQADSCYQMLIPYISRAKASEHAKFLAETYLDLSAVTSESPSVPKPTVDVPTYTVAFTLYSKLETKLNGNKSSEVLSAKNSREEENDIEPVKVCQTLRTRLDDSAIGDQAANLYYQMFKRMDDNDRDAEASQLRGTFSRTTGNNSLAGIKLYAYLAPAFSMNEAERGAEILRGIVFGMTTTHGEGTVLRVNNETLAAITAYGDLSNRVTTPESAKGVILLRNTICLACSISGTLDQKLCDTVLLAYDKVVDSLPPEGLLEEAKAWRQIFLEPSTFPLFRHAAVQAYGDIAETASFHSSMAKNELAKLFPLLQSENPDVRRAATEAIGELGGKILPEDRLPIAKTIREHLFDDPEVRIEAFKAYSKLVYGLQNDNELGFGIARLLIFLQNVSEDDPVYKAALQTYKITAIGLSRRKMEDQVASVRILMLTPGDRQRESLVMLYKDIVESRLFNAEECLLEAVALRNHFQDGLNKAADPKIRDTAIEAYFYLVPKLDETEKLKVAKILRKLFKDDSHDVVMDAMLTYDALGIPEKEGIARDLMKTAMDSILDVSTIDEIRDSMAEIYRKRTDFLDSSTADQNMHLFLSAFASPNRNIRKNALVVTEVLLEKVSSSPQVLQAVLPLINDPDDAVKLSAMEIMNKNFSALPAVSVSDLVKRLLKEVGGDNVDTWETALKGYVKLVRTWNSSDQVAHGIDDLEAIALRETGDDKRIKLDQAIAQLRSRFSELNGGG